MTDPRYRKVPSARLARLASFGQMAGGIAGGMLAEGARRLASGERPRLSDLLLTPGNAMRVTDQLSRLRGAAMKLGQMISMDAGDILPVELTAILAKLRDTAHFMPPPQLNRVLASEWGANWRGQFAHFEATPIAAASIGQVHRAALPSGQVVAVKVQYPGVARSIDADVDNVASLLRMSGMLPHRLDIAPLLEEAKRQLHEEADYVREAEQMRRYSAMLAGDPAFIVPSPVDALSRKQVLVMEFAPGEPIEALQAAPQAIRDSTMAALLGLVLRELFEFGYMQTDPNFANFRWQAETGRIVLLDFGAAREVPGDTVEAYGRLLHAGLQSDQDAVIAALIKVGFISAATLQRHRRVIDDMVALTLKHAGKAGQFDFADRSFVGPLLQHSETIFADRGAWHVPPADTLFVQRKLSGIALLAIRLRARMPLRDMVTAVLNR